MFVTMRKRMRLKEVDNETRHGKAETMYPFHSLDIPALDLSGRIAGSSSGYATSPEQTAFSSRGNTPDPSDHGSRRASFSSTGRPPANGRPGSGSSSRSTSFSLPPEAIAKEFRSRSRSGERGEIEEEEMDEESKFCTRNPGLQSLTYTRPSISEAGGLFKGSG